MRGIFVIVLMLLLTKAWAQLPTHEVSNRVAASDPISGAGSAMPVGLILSLIHISEPTRRRDSSRMPSSA